MEKPSTEGFLFKPEAPAVNSSELFSNKNTIIIVLVATICDKVWKVIGEWLFPHRRAI